MEKPKKGKKVGLAQRDLRWRLKKYGALQRLISSYTIRNSERLSIDEQRDRERAILEINALGVQQLRGKITTIPHRYVSEVIQMAIEGCGDIELLRTKAPNERYLEISRWLRQQGLPVPSLSAVSKFFSKNQ